MIVTIFDRFGERIGRGVTVLDAFMRSSLPQDVPRTFYRYVAGLKFPQPEGMWFYEERMTQHEENRRESPV